MSFSSSSSPRGSEEHVVVPRKGEKKKAEEEPAALDLLDDYWFFSNPLGGGRDGANSKGRTTTTRPPLLPKSPSTSSAGASSPGGRKAKADACRRLLRTPSLPAPRIGLEQPSSPPKDEELVDDDAGGGDRQEGEAEEDDDMNWSKIYEGVLRTRIAEEGRRSSELNRAPSMPLTSSATMGSRRPAGFAKSTPSMPRLRHSHSTLDRHFRPHTPTKPDRTPRMTGGGGGRAERGPPRRELRSFSANQQPALVRDKSSLNDKMWKSSSALESIEVQGFKDLGFVFDQEELRESLADVLPGLRDDKTTTKPPHKSPSSVVSVSGSISGSASDNDDPNAADSNNGAGIGIGASNAVCNDGVVQRPYLSEAWQHGARSAPPTGAAAIRLHQADARSAAEMKDQIRMWAQAVACNVRQEC